MRNFRETFRANGWLVTEPVEYWGNEQAVRLRRVLSYAVAERIIEEEMTTEPAGVSAAEFMREFNTFGQKRI